MSGGMDTGPATTLFMSAPWNTRVDHLNQTAPKQPYLEHPRGALLEQQRPEDGQQSEHHEAPPHAVQRGERARVPRWENLRDRAHHAPPRGLAHHARRHAPVQSTAAPQRHRPDHLRHRNRNQRGAV